MDGITLGNLKIDSPFWLAPMAGYTDQAMRQTCRAFGGGLYYTEVAVAQGLVRGSKPTWHLMEAEAHEAPLAGHIYGSEPDVMAEAARQMEATGRFVAIDINCGCPVRKIVAKGAGAALIREPARIEAIVRSVVAAVRLPVLVKTRIGYEPGENRILEIAPRVEQAGAAALAVHGRYAVHQHKGPVDWGLIEQVRNLVRIPVLGNGGLHTAHAAVTALREHGLQGVLLARGAVGNPWIFEDATCLLHARPIPMRDYGDLRTVVRAHLARLMHLKKIEAKCRRRKDFAVDRGTALHFRCHLIQYLAGLEHWADLRRMLNRVTGTDQILCMLDTVIERQTRPWWRADPSTGNAG